MYNNYRTVIGTMITYIYITSKRYSVGLAYPVARGIGAIGQL